MLNRVTSVLIGKDITRDAQVVAGAQLDTITKSTGLADGEIVVLDSNKKVLAAGATIADSDTIYVVQATTDTFDYTNKAGTAVTGNRRIRMSGPIVGAKVKSYKSEPFVVKAEKTAAVDLTGWTPVVGTEYIVRIVYKDMNEHPGKFTQTYRYVGASATLDTEAAAIAAKINAHSGRRVDASYATSTDILTLTAREIPECCTSLTDIDRFRMVDFDVYFNYVASSGAWTVIPSTSTTVTYTGPTYGSGNWEQIRDLENDVQGYLGISNITQFPVVKPDYETVVDETYDMIVIEHEVPYQSPDNQYVKQAPQTTVIVVPYTATTNQMDSLLAQLNPWMASCPGAFANLSF